MYSTVSSSDGEKQKGRPASAGTSATVLVTAAPLSRGECPSGGRRAPRLGRAARPPSGPTQRRLVRHARLCTRYAQEGPVVARPPEWEYPTARRPLESRPDAPSFGGQARATKLSGPPCQATASDHTTPNTPLSSVCSTTRQGMPSAPGAASRRTRVLGPPRQAERDTAARAPKRCKAGRSAARRWTSGTPGLHWERVGHVRLALGAARGWAGSATQSLAAWRVLSSASLHLRPM